MANKLPTAEELLLKHCNPKTNDFGTSFGNIGEMQCKRAMIEFTKLHLTSILEFVNEKMDLYPNYDDLNLTQRGAYDAYLNIQRETKILIDYLQ